MKAFAADRFGAGASSCRVRELPDPSAGAGEVLVAVRAAALNRADLRVLAGELSGRALHAAEAPCVVGYDFSGVVAAADGSRWSAGDDVFGFLAYGPRTRGGTLAELVVAPSARVAAKPSGVPHHDAAAVATTGCTALQALRDEGRLRAGARVLVHGASGGVGSCAVQIARLLGASEVVGTCSPAKAGFVQRLGAARVFDHHTTPVRGLPGPFDVILDAAAASSWGACRGVLARRGAYVTVIPSPRFVAGALRSLGSRRRCALVTVRPRRADLEELARWLADGSLRAAVEPHALADAPVALDRLARGLVEGKAGIVLDGWPP